MQSCRPKSVSPFHGIYLGPQFDLNVNPWTVFMLHTSSVIENKQTTFAEISKQ